MCWETNLRNKILFRILSLLVTGILASVIVSVVLMLLYGPNWMNEINDSMIGAEKSSLKYNSESKSGYEYEVFLQALSDVNMLHKYTSDLLNNKLTNHTITSYAGNLDLADTMQQEQLSNDLLRLVETNLTASMYYVPDFATLADIQNDETVWDAVTKTSVLDYIYKSVLLSNSRYLWIYIGLEETGLYRMFPFADASSYPDKTISCPREGIFTETHVGYDPRCRGWYSSALEEGELVFTSPYIDITNNKLLITAAKAVFNDTDHSVIGVVALDLSIDELEGEILKTKILVQGYAYVVDTNTTNVVIHPKLTDRESAPPNLLQVEFGVICAKECIEFKTSVLNRIVSLEQFDDSFEKSGESWFGSWNPVTIPFFELGIVVPKADIIAPSEEVSSNISSMLSLQVVFSVLISIIIITALVFVTNYFAGKIVKPITSLTKLCVRVTNGDLDNRPSKQVEEPLCSEMFSLSKTFKSLMTAVRFGNDYYFENDLEQSKTCFQDALEMFSKMGSKKGTSICHNNLGAIYMRMGLNDESMRHYDQAIAIADEELKKNPNNIDAIKSFATRLNNKALLLMQSKQWNEAERLLTLALSYDKKTMNAIGFATRSGNLGQIYLQTNQKDRAIYAFEQAQKLTSDPAVLATIPPNDILLAQQNSEMNLGLGYLALDQPEKAWKYLVKSLTKPITDPVARDRALQSLLEVYRKYIPESKPSIASLTRAVSTMTKKLMKKKALSLCLDTSGSMSGGRIRSSLENLYDLWDHYVLDDDLIAFITFNDKSRVIFPMTQKGPEKDRLNRMIRNTERPKGRTALYDALGSAISLLEEVKEDGVDRWLVCLTDGDDTNSVSYNEVKLMQKLHRTHIDGIIIITVGRDVNNVEFLRRVVETNKKGELLKCEQVDKLREAFAKVAEMISGQAVLESW